MKKGLLILIALVFVGLVVVYSSDGVIFSSKGGETQLNQGQKNPEKTAPPKAAVIIPISSPDKKTGVYVSGKEVNEKTLPAAVQNKPIQEISVYREYPENLASEFDNLKILADGGDINAAFILGKLLQTCSFEPKTAQEYNQIISKDYSTSIEVADYGYKLCKGITKQQLRLSTTYLEQAASEGDVEAQLEFFRAVPLEIDDYSDSYKPNNDAEKEYLESVYKKKRQFLETAVNNGNIDAAIVLGMAYSDEISPTVTGYDIEKSLEYLFLAQLMDPNDTMSVSSFIDYLRVKTPVDTFEQIRRSTEQQFSEQFENRQITLLEQPTY